MTSQWTFSGLVGTALVAVLWLVVLGAGALAATPTPDAAPPPPAAAPDPVPPADSAVQLDSAPAQPQQPAAAPPPEPAAEDSAPAAGSAPTAGSAPSTADAPAPASSSDPSSSSAAAVAVRDVGPRRRAASSSHRPSARSAADRSGLLRLTTPQRVEPPIASGTLASVSDAEELLLPAAAALLLVALAGGSFALLVMRTEGLRGS